MAFDQEELADLLDDGQKTIYLCGEKFNVPVSQHDIAYIGVNTPIVHLSGTLPEGMESTGITFHNCTVENMPETNLKPLAVDDTLSRTNYRNLPLFPKSDEAIRYGTFTMESKDIGYYEFAVAINPDGTINRIIDCLAGNQKRDEYIDRSDKFYDDLMRYLVKHKDDPDLYLHLSPYDVVCSEKSAIHSLRGNVFKTYEEYVEHVNSCYGV